MEQAEAVKKQSQYTEEKLISVWRTNSLFQAKL